MSEIDKEDFSDIAADYPHSNDGFDKEGRPGIYFSLLYNIIVSYLQTMDNV